MKNQTKQYVESKPFLSNFGYLIKQKQYSGAVRFLFEDCILRWIYLSSSLLARMVFTKSFSYNRLVLNYSNDIYNKSFGCERTIEIPIALNFIQNKKNILEVGSVLSHYKKQSWTIVDKFEKSPGVINQDVLNYKPTKNHDCIVSISTIEHVGIDDTVTDPKLGLKAIEKCKTLLKPQGEMLISIPVGYNPILDKQFLGNGIFTHVYALLRITPWNTWKQVEPKSIINAKYGWPYNNANAILIGYYHKTK